jgi:hypothetical protein
MADPGQGIIRFNNATIASATAIAIDDLTIEGTDVSPYLLTFDDSTNTPSEGHLIIESNTNADNTYAVFSVTGLTDNVGWVQYAVTYVSGTLPSDAEQLVISFSRTGDRGLQGTTGTQGATGTNGTIGAQGTTGTQGITGTQGTTGTQGATGTQGFTGLQGTSGTTGAQGTIGATGSQGATGTTGLQGISGVNGSVGPEGIQGPTGATGAQGIQGATGLQGISGATSNSFATISTPSGTSPVADSVTDTLTYTATNGIIITGNSGTDSIEFSTNATSANGSSTIISRDVSGSFTANVITTTTGFIGIGAGLSSLNGSNVSSGTVSSTYLPSASSAASGIVTTSTQAFAGRKTFEGGINISGSATTIQLGGNAGTAGYVMTSQGGATLPTWSELPYRIAANRTTTAGGTALTVNTQETATTVTFPASRFSGTPSVVAATSSARLSISVGSVSSTGFTMIVRNVSDATATTYTWNYQAIEIVAGMGS